MKAAQLFFAVMTTTYILIAVRFEQDDLVSLHGEKYRERVPMVIPKPGAKVASHRA